MSRFVVLWFVGIVTGVLFAVMVFHAAPFDPSIPTIHFSFSAASFDAILAKWQDGGIARFKMHFAIDFPFLISYGLFGYLLAVQISLSSKLPAYLRSILCWAAPCAAVADASENLLHLYFLNATSAIPGELYFLAGIAATFKWTVAVAFVIGIIYVKVWKPE